MSTDGYHLHKAIVHSVDVATGVVMVKIPAILSNDVVPVDPEGLPLDGLNIILPEPGDIRYVAVSPHLDHFHWVVSADSSPLWTKSYETSTNLAASAGVLDTRISDHINDATAAHDGSAITYTPSAPLTAATIQAAIDQLAGFPQGRRNMIDNGHLAVNQRNATTLLAHTGGYMADRHYIQNSGVGVTALSYVPNDGVSFGTEVPAGRPRPGTIQYLSMTTADVSLAATDALFYQQAIEGFNLQHLLWGTAQAKPVTLSFDCFSTVAATYVTELFRNEATSRFSAQAFTVPAGFSTVKLTFPGDPTTLVTNDSTARLYTITWICAGSNVTSTPLLLPFRNFVATARATGVSNNFAATIGNVFVMTNVQLEAGAIATPYEVRSYSEELQTCMRYFERIDSAVDANAPFGAGMNYTTTQAIAVVPYKVRKRAIPTASYSAAGLFAIYTAPGGLVALNAIVTNQIGVHSVQVGMTTNATQIAGNATTLKANNNAGTFIDISAEI